jgi:hypothetical protein
MKKYLFLFLILFITNSAVRSQSTVRKCGTHERVNARLGEHPENILQRESIEKFTDKWVNDHPSYKKSSIITIPVVIHVVYKSTIPAENISDAQIQSQLAVLNKDYRRLNTDSGSTPQPFKLLAADCEIQFCLAAQDPQGKATTGITRKATSIAKIGNTAYYYSSADGGQDMWDPAHYMNIWVCNIDGGSTLGFAWPPGTSGPKDDGIVIDYRYFGTIGKNPPFHLGRTVTHEVGHYLNLDHVWGDDGGDCTGSDNVSDTPNQAEETYDCPNFPLTDMCTLVFPGVMFMNYMDYTDDNCMNMFTKGQKLRMQGALNGPRISLQASKACQVPTGISERNNEFQSLIYPNPSNGIFIIETNTNVQAAYKIEVFNILGRMIREASGSGISDKINLDLTGQVNGVYFVKMMTKEGTSIHKVFLDSDLN